jgi:hypothetical protein
MNEWSALRNAGINISEASRKEKLSGREAKLCLRITLVNASEFCQDIPCVRVLEFKCGKEVTDQGFAPVGFGHSLRTGVFEEASGNPGAIAKHGGLSRCDERIGSGGMASGKAVRRRLSQNLGASMVTFTKS